MNKFLKIAVISLITIVLMSGCFKKTDPNNNGDNNNNPGNENKVTTLTCEMSDVDEDGEIIDYNKEIITYKGDIILKLESSSTSVGDEDFVNAFTTVFNKMAESFTDLEHASMNLTKETDTKITVTSTIDFEKIDMNKFLEIVEKLNEEMPDASNKTANYVVDNKLIFSKYKAEALKDYTCK